MCGIAGILNFNRSKVLHDDLQKITDVIAHRGPDGEGHWINENKNVGFGHRRLSIIDLTDSGKQPMHYASGRYTITFNGEIYNYIELRELLKTKGYIFLSNSDTEVLLAMYDWKKEHCLSFLDGMFAFAIWDENEQSLFCARDRFGEKPFYYSLENGKEFCFASEMKALWAHGISKENDNKVLDNYLKTGSAIFAEDATKTFYAKIKQLDSGHYLIINNKMELLTKCYYHLDHIQLNKNIKLTDAIEEFKQLFLESIKLRLRSDVSVGSSLSGGLDSSSIVMLIDSLKDSMINQHTFSARFDGFVRDEGVQMHQVLNKCKNVVPHEVWPQEQEFQEIIDKIIFHQEEPFGSSSVFAQWKVMELAKKNGTVVLLDGQGADEYLAGYLPFYGLYFKQLFFTNKKKYQYEKAAYFKLRGIEGTSFESEETLRMKIGRLKRSMMNQKMPYD